MVSVPILSLPFVLNKLIPFRNALCLKILFQSALGLPQQISSEAFLRNALNLILKVKYTSEKSVGVKKKRPLPRHGYYLGTVLSLQLPLQLLMCLCTPLTKRPEMMCYYSCGVRASHDSGFPCCGAQALGCMGLGGRGPRAQQLRFPCSRAHAQ